MSSVVISGDTSGAITLSAPAVAGTNTITLPAAAGSVMVSGNMPAFSAYLGSAQTIGSGTWTKVTCQTEEFDTNSNYDNSTNYRFTPTVAGYYQFTGSVGVVTSQTGIGISFYKNGSAFKQVQNTGSVSTSTTSGSALIYCNGSTDYVEMYVYLNTGQGIQTGVTQTYFQATMTRGA